MTVTFEPLHSALGAEVHGVDLHAPIDDATRAKLRTAFDQFGLLLVRQAGLDADAHRRFVEAIGPVRDPHGYISNVEASGYQPEWELLFHSDFLFTDQPLEGISLYALEIGTGVAPTRFASAAHGAKSLPKGLRAQLLHLRVVHMADLTSAGREDIRQREEDLGGPDAPRDKYPRSVRPVLSPHPRTGEELLSVAQQQASHFEGMSYADSDALLDRIFAHLHGDPSSVYDHNWQVGDLLLWDNLKLVHGRPAAPTTVRRSLRRITMTSRTVAEILGSLHFDDRPEANAKINQ
jgi:alpha-ketoglutarate-dependent taurine dioxygenase